MDKKNTVSELLVGQIVYINGIEYLTLYGMLIRKDCISMINADTPVKICHENGKTHTQIVDDNIDTEKQIIVAR